MLPTCINKVYQSSQYIGGFTPHIPVKWYAAHNPSLNYNMAKNGLKKRMTEVWVKFDFHQ
jgi:hypothetical protein